MISPVRPSTTAPVRPAKSTNSFSPATWVWRIVGFSRPAQPRYRSQNQEYPNPSGAPARYSSHSSASVTLGRRSSRCTQAHSGIELCGQRPAHSGGAGPAEIAAHRSLAQPQALGNRALRQLAGKPQSQNFADLAHLQSLGRHLVPLLFGKGASLPSGENCPRRGPVYPHFALIPITESMISFGRNE